MRSSMFPDAHASGLEDRVAEFWDLGWPLPMPRAQITCHCGGLMVIKDWKFHERRTGTRHPWRCDVRFKCIDCSVVPTCGVVVPQSMDWHHGGWIGWREGKEALASAGYFEESECRAAR